MKNVFLPMDASGQPSLAEVRQEQNLPPGIERRRHTRHRFSTSIEIQVEDPRGRFDIFDAMTFEISESGLSAATPNILFVGERVELFPILGYRLPAVVRRKNGAMYGFEFVGLSEAEGQAIAGKCERLPLFTSLLDV